LIDFQRSTAVPPVFELGHANGFDSNERWSYDFPEIPNYSYDFGDSALTWNCDCDFDSWNVDDGPQEADFDCGCDFGYDEVTSFFLLAVGSHLRPFLSGIAGFGGLVRGVGR